MSRGWVCFVLKFEEILFIVVEEEIEGIDWFYSISQEDDQIRLGVYFFFFSWFDIIVLEMFVWLLVVDFLEILLRLYLQVLFFCECKFNLVKQYD